MIAQGLETNRNTMRNNTRRYFPKKAPRKNVYFLETSFVFICFIGVVFILVINQLSIQKLEEESIASTQRVLEKNKIRNIISPSPLNGYNFAEEQTNAVDRTQLHPSNIVLQVRETKTVEVESTSSSPYAYVWIIGAVHEEKPSYKGFVWDVLVSASLLRKTGSTADFWLYVRLSPESKLDKMPQEELRLLDALDVKVKHLEKPAHESFSQLMYDKFFILNMVEYKRVMFLDADTIPLTNLDFYFHLSDPEYKEMPTLLKPFFLYASRKEPLNGGLFIVEPSKEIYDKYKETVRAQHERAKTLPYPHFDRDEGWGYNFKSHGDKWEAVNIDSNRWGWYGAHVDQGLMYYVAKFLSKEVSIAIGSKVKNYKGVDAEVKPELESETEGMLVKYQPDLLAFQYRCDEYIVDKTVREKDKKWICNPPYSSISHFYGKNKPWQNEFEVNSLKKPLESRVKKGPSVLWFKELVYLNEKHEMGIDFENWNKKHLPILKESSLGYIPWYADQTVVMQDIKKRSDFDQSTTSELTPTNPDNKGPHQQQYNKAPVVAYAISFIKCGDHQNIDAAGLIDASLILRHSIHKISSRNPESGSKYDYKMYAIVHRQAEQCSSALAELGFEIRVVDPPVKKEEIRGEYLRKHIHRERCCGADEFIKLEAYSLPEDVIVHVDIDVAFYKPMDHLFDAILYDKDSAEGQAAREAIELERPGEKLPDKIGAFITRDWTQVVPGKWPPGYQAGFLVARRDPSIMPAMVEVVKEGNYTEGWGYNYGWGNKGYAGWVGAMAMQGLVAYYYDHINTDNAVELNQCLYNHMGVDVKRGGKCRNGSESCEDCMQTSMSDIYNMHHTMCRKPWLCQATGAAKGRKPGEGRATALNTDVVTVDHCLEMSREWHLLRVELEGSLFELTKDANIHLGITGGYRKDIFQGHCKDDGSSHYMNIAGSPETMRRVHELYK